MRITLKTRSVVIIFKSCKATKHSINNKSQTWPHIIPKRNAITKNSISSYHWVVNCTSICLLEGSIKGVSVSKWLWESFFFGRCSSNARHFRFYNEYLPCAEAGHFDPSVSKAFRHTSCALVPSFSSLTTTPF